MNKNEPLTYKTMKKNTIKQLTLIVSFGFLALLSVPQKTEGQSLGGNYPPSNKTIYNYSTIEALMSGSYDGELALEGLRTKGDLGIGTFNALDGEMLLLDGEFYQIKSDGQVYQPPLTTKTPFAAVTNFEKDLSFDINGDTNLQNIQEIINAKINGNYPYAVRIEGEFNYIKTRSVPKQIKPYPLLAEIAKNQPIFEMQNQTGTLIGFIIPNYLKEINIPGFHLHYLSADHKSGGHLLDVISKNVKVYLNQKTQVFLDLPTTQTFSEHQTNKDLYQQINAVEGGKN